MFRIWIKLDNVATKSQDNLILCVCVCVCVSEQTALLGLSSYTAYMTHGEFSICYATASTCGILIICSQGENSATVSRTRATRRLRSYDACDLLHVLFQVVQHVQEHVSTS